MISEAASGHEDPGSGSFDADRCEHYGFCLYGAVDPEHCLVVRH
jgi:hypothetical protein